MDKIKALIAQISEIWESSSGKVAGVAIVSAVAGALFGFFFDAFAVVFELVAKVAAFFV
jgi:hypothetical protein